MSQKEKAGEQEKIATLFTIRFPQEKHLITYL
jgi:hypothetical protein